MTLENSSSTSFDMIVLTKFPYPIAVGYRRILSARDWRERIDLSIKLLEYGMRVVALCVIAQYIIRDEQVSDSALNEFLVKKFPRKATIGTSMEMLFTSLKAYKDKRDIFFIPELYDLYWDTSASPHQPRSGVQTPYVRLIEIRNELEHRFAPKTDTAWQELGEKVMNDLHEVLGQFVFFQRYDLLRIVAKNEKKYTYTRYKGETIEVSQTLESPIENLKIESFYLAKNNRRFLLLDPVMVFLEDHSISNLAVIEAGDAAIRESFTRKSLIEVGDAAIYESFTRKNVTYLATVLQQAFEDESKVSEFIHLIYYNIDKLKKHRREVQRFTWELLLEISQKIATQRFASIRERFQENLYLPRREIIEAFRDFLASDKTVFLLLGKSGVGKSNFLISLANECQQENDSGVHERSNEKIITKDEVCLLLYDGANLETEKPLAETIGQDIEANIRLIRDNEEISIKDFLSEIAHIYGIEQRKVILFVDAVNENPDPKSLLRRIDALVASSAYPWFKVVFSSRPEAWRAMKRKVALAEHRYYRVSGKEEIGIELQQFGVEMTPFTRAELPQVYEKYREVHNLQTTYTGLSPEVRSLLRDPLTLKLVAETYDSDLIPPNIRSGEIYQKYVEQLINDHRLHVEDLIFLEEDLMPMMLPGGQNVNGRYQHGAYTNVLPAEKVNSALTVKGRRLVELIFGDERLSNGEQINQSFINLAGAEILVTRGSSVDYEIGFKYERFYDYYGGRRLHKLANEQKDVLEFLQGLCDKTSEKPFLWGPVKDLLIKELDTQEPGLLYALASTDSQRTKELIVSALIDFGRDKRREAENLLHEFLGRYSEKSGQASSASIAPAQIAIEVAYNLESMDILQEMATAKIQNLRLTAVQYICYLGSTQPWKAIQILKYVRSKSLNRIGLPTWSMASGIGISAGLMLAHTKDLKLMQQLREIWNPVIEALLHEKNPGRQIVFRRLFQRAVIWVTARAMVSYLTHDDSNLRTQELRTFFALPASQRELQRRIAPYLNPTHGDIRDIRSDILKAAESTDSLTYFTVGILITLRGISNLDEVMPVMKELFDKTITVSPPGPYPQGLCAMIYMLIDSRPRIEPELVELLGSFVWSIWELHGGYWESDTKRYHHPWVDRYIMAYFRLHEQESERIAPSLFTHLESEKNRHEYELHLYLLKVAENIGSGFGQTSLALKLIELALEIHDKKVFAELISTQAFEENFINALSTIRKSSPDDVDDFMEEHDFAPRLKDLVRARTPLVDAFGLPHGYGVGLQPKVIQSKGLTSALTILLNQIADYKSVPQMMENVIRLSVNFAYGDPIL